MTALTRDDCLALDAADPLARFRGQFHLREGLIYLDGNSLGPMPKATARRLAQVMQDEWAEGLITSWLNADWVNAPARIGDKLAKLIGAAPGEIVVADSTSINIFKALGAACQINNGRDVILSEAGNFPTDIYMMQGFERFSGGKIKARIVPPDDVLAHVDGNVAALLLTQVHYKTGRVRDMAAITRRAHDAGVLVIWDLSHSAGSIPVDLNGAGADFAVGCGYKFLNGGPGAPAFIFVAKRHQAAAAPLLSGWFGHRQPFAFDDHYEPAPGIARYLCGTPSILGMAALECGLDLFAQADIARVRDKAKKMGALFIALMAHACAGHGFQLLSPTDDDARGSQVSFAHPNGYEIMQALKKRDVIGDFRAPDVLRFGLTPLYLRYCDVFDAVAAIQHIMESRAWDDPAYKIRQAVT